MISKKQFKTAGIVSLISGIVLIFLSLLGFLGLMMTYLMKREMPTAGLFSHIITWIIILITLYCGYIGFRKFEKKKGFPFYISLILLSFGVVHLVVWVISFITSYEYIIVPATIIASTLFTLINSVVFIINGVYLLE